MIKSPLHQIPFFIQISTTIGTIADMLQVFTIYEIASTRSVPPKATHFGEFYVQDDIDVSIHSKIRNWSNSFDCFQCTFQHAVEQTRSVSYYL